MQLGNNYKIESDALNVMVFKRTRPKKGGKGNWKIIGYFSCVKNALEFIVDLEVNETGMIDFKTVAAKQNELYELIDSLELKGIEK